MGIAEAIHNESIIIDAHCDTLSRVYEGQRRLGQFSDIGQFDLPRAQAGGVTAVFLATFVSDKRPGSAAHQTMQLIDVFYEELDSNTNMAMHGRSAEDVTIAKKSGNVAMILSMEGAEGLEGDLRLLRTYHRLGLRMLGITWNRRNEAADGVAEMRTGGGLTQFGAKLVKECDHIGVVIDVAHLSPAGFDDVLEISENPIVASHANCYTLWQHPRNLTDAQLEAIAKTRGVVGVTPVPTFLGENDMHNTLPVLVDHIDHMVKVMGEDGVGLGLDFDGVGDRRVEGIEDASKLLCITEELVNRSYSAETIQKILGGNFLRVFREIC